MATKIDEMSARTVEQDYVQKAKAIPSFLFSADSHVDEPTDLWDSLPDDVRAVLPKLGAYAKDKRPAGGLDPKIRLEHMDLDGVSAEILYPTTTLRVFATPQKAQEGAFRLAIE